MTARRGNSRCNTGAREMNQCDFEAVGTCRQIIFPRGAIAGWRTSSALVVEAKGGLLHMRDSLFTLGRGAFRIRPVEDCQFSATFYQPVCLLSYRRLAEMLRGKYVFTPLPDRRVNLWPYLFDHYVRTSNLPTRVREFEKIFERILQSGDAAALSGKTQTRLQSLKRRLWTAVLHGGRSRSAMPLARQYAEMIIQKLVEADFYPEMIANMEAFISLGRRDGIVPLVAEFAQDEIRPKTPLQIAVAERVTVEGRCYTHFMWEYGELFGDGMFCTFIDLTPAVSAGLPNRLKVYTAKAHIQLDYGRKKARGVTVAAPLSCNCEEATLHLSNGPADTRERLKEEIGRIFFRRSVRSRPGDLFLKASAKAM